MDQIQAPEGTRDLLPDEAAFWTSFKATAARVFGRYGYVTIETPIMEQTDLFVRGIGQATDVVSKEMFATYSGENLRRLIAGEHLKAKSRMSLRPEGTAGVVRAVVQNDLVPQGGAPAKLMYAGPMFRAERPQKGRLRQFNQVGVECLGAEAPTVDAEAIIMLMRFFAELGIPANNMRLLMNSMGCEHCRPAYREAVRAFMEAHAGELCETCLTRAQTNPLRAFDCKNAACADVMADAPKITEFLCDDCREHYAAVKALVTGAGLAFTEDAKLVRGLDYYTRTVFEVQVDNGMGAQNAIGGGGRYDKLAEEVGGRPTPGIGFALGYERTLLALQAAGFELPRAGKCDLFVACVADAAGAGATAGSAAGDAGAAASDASAAMRDAFAIVQAARDAGLCAEMDHQRRSLKSQFKLADKLGARFVAVLGPDERAVGECTLRNMATHDEARVPLTSVPAAILAQN